MMPSRPLRTLRQGLESTLELAGREGLLLVRNLGLISAGVTVLALGVVVGRELRQRYKFQRRTPYDVYAHAGDQAQDMDFGVGV